MPIQTPIKTAFMLLATTTALINLSLPIMAQTNNPKFPSQEELSIPNYAIDLTKLRFQWSVGGFIHKTTFNVQKLSLSPFVTSRTTYWDPEKQREECVIQDVKIYDSPDGMVILSDNVRDCLTGRKNSVYSPDDFLISVNSTKGGKAFVRDHRGVGAIIRIEELKK